MVHEWHVTYLIGKLPGCAFELLLDILLETKRHLTAFGSRISLEEGKERTSRIGKKGNGVRYG